MAASPEFESVADIVERFPPASGQGETVAKVVCAGVAGIAVPGTQRLVEELCLAGFKANTPTPTNGQPVALNNIIVDGASIKCVTQRGWLGNEQTTCLSSQPK